MIVAFWLLLALLCFPIPTWGADQVSSDATAELTRVEMVSRGSKAPFVQLVPQNVPILLEKAPEGGWLLSLRFRSELGELNILSGQQVKFLKRGEVTLPVRIQTGSNSIKITVVLATGATADYEVIADVKLLTPEQGDPRGFFIIAPLVYQRSISRQGSAITDPGTASAMMPGLRGIFRRRLFKNFTDRLPAKIKIFFDGSGTLGKTMGGDEGAQGMPFWGDARMTFELFQASDLRIELGTGYSIFAPMLTTSRPGDIEQFSGFVFSARLGYPLTKKLFGLMGGAMTFPSTANSTTSVFVSQPLELFASLSTPWGSNSFIELRLKYYALSTMGTIFQSGNLERKESYLGPELLWVNKF
ncbi:hypothetical protein WDW37_05535 [Bdellovibrionota bacterium FG-1]